MNKALYLISFLVICVLNTKAQTIGSCTDPNNPAQPTYSCGRDYFPVCGCDGITYRNDCTAKFRAGLLYTTDGCCGSFDFDITPNAVTYQLDLEIYRKTRGYVLVTVFNTLGYREFEYQIFVPDAASIGGAYEFPLDLNFLDSGIYLLQVVSDGGQLVKKFYKYRSD